MLFEWDFVTNTFKIKDDLNGLNGQTPVDSLLEIKYHLTSKNEVQDTAVYLCGKTSLTQYYDKLKFNLYPNHTNSSISINLGRIYTNAQLTITSLDGKIILMENYNELQVINTNMEANPGIYIASITTENESIVFKVVKY